MRAKHRNKPLHKSRYTQKLCQWYATTRKRLVRTRFEDSYGKKWGLFTLEHCLNVDQIPCPSDLNVKRTYHPTEKNVNQRQRKFQISQAGSGLDKRQCSLQIFVRPVGTQPRLSIIFCRKGLQISEAYKYCILQGR